MKYFFIILFSSIVFTLNSQSFKSIHQSESEKYGAMDFKTEKEWDKYNNFKKIDIIDDKGCQMDKIVFGWHPYWGGSNYLNYQWSYLTDMAYFSYEVDYTDGSALSTHSWETSPVVDSAQKYGVRVHLCVTLFGNHDQFFANGTAQQNLIDNLVNLVATRNAIGINIDFEGMGNDNRDDFTAFMQNLNTALKNQIPDGILSVCLYAVDWNDVFDIPSLDNCVDYYTIMGYDYYYGGSSEAGPTGQLYVMNSVNSTQSKSISYYLNEGASREKLLLGIPYFGFQWQTQSSSVPSSTIGSGSSKTIKVIKDNADSFYSNPNIEPNSLGKYYAFQNGGNWYQAWVDDEKTMKYTYKMVNQQGIGGIAIWALGYDDGYTEMWELIRDYFSECAVVPISDTIWDLGGPTRVHFNNESFVYTIKPTCGTTLQLNFTDFELEANYDSLYIYDGESTSDALIGGYSGSTSPGLITASGNALTLRYFSDGATVKQGWTAIWNSTPDSELPTTNISAPEWVSDDFDVQFTDNDNLEIKNSFYQVLNFDGTEWRANKNFGFFNDNFNASIHSDWTDAVGSWSISDGHLLQSDDALGNTNLYFEMPQEYGNVYLYHWQMNLSGTAGNRRGGIHLFCDDASQENRHNNYMVYFRADQDAVQIYEYNDNIYSLKTDDYCQIEPDTWYDYKVIYNSNTGEIKAFVNNQLVSSWIDYNHIKTGNYVSLRVGNAVAYFDDFKIYNSRDEQELVSVGSIEYELPFENIDSVTPAARIKSVVIDANNNFSEIASKDVNIDFSIPDAVFTVNDGDLEDIDTTYSVSHLSANWTAANDDNSGISAYWYAVGTSPNNDDVFQWSKGDNQTNTNIIGLNLEYENIYYFSIKAENLSGLLSNSTSSDGLRVVLAEQPPTADFEISDSETCTGIEVNYMYTGMNATDFLWIFEGADTDTSYLMNPYVTYSNSGTFDVKLIVSNNFGQDTLLITDAITVYQTPFVDFIANITSGEIPLLVEFENLSDENGTSYYWNFGDEYFYQSNVYEQFTSHYYNSFGNFSVSLIVENEHCTAENFKTDYISVFPASIDEIYQFFRIFPNPVNDFLIIENLQNINFNVEITNTSAAIVHKSQNSEKIDLSGLSAGVYILKIITENGFYTKKIIKQ